jgi:serine/threonine protein kinase
MSAAGSERDDDDSSSSSSGRRHALIPTAVPGIKDHVSRPKAAPRRPRVGSHDSTGSSLHHYSFAEHSIMSSSWHQSSQLNSNSLHAESNHVIVEGGPSSDATSRAHSQEQASLEHSPSTPMPTRHVTSELPTENPSVDQERQFLVLMLLAQVCALHDPTPRTFIVHVLELVEQRILHTSSIQFLFDLGLLPSWSEPKLLTLGPSSPLSSDHREQSSDLDQWLGTSSDSWYKHSVGERWNSPNKDSTKQKTDVASKEVLASKLQQTASAIRSRLEKQDWLNQQHQRRALQSRDWPGPTSKTLPPPVPETKESSPQHSSWSVKHHPLSLSRYQREFEEIALLASGGFGQVFHVRHRMDQCEYAVKRVVFDASGYSWENIGVSLREIQCLASCHHRNVVRYYTGWLEPSWMTGSHTDQTTGSPAILPQGTRALFPPQRPLLALLDQGSGASSRDEGSSRCSATLESASADLERYFRDDALRHRISIDDRYDFSHESADPQDDSHRGYESSEWTISNQDHVPVYFGGAETDMGIEFIDSDEDENDEKEASSSRSLLPGVVRSRRNRQQRRRPDSSRPNQRRGSAHGASNQLQHRYQYQICLCIQMQLCHPATLADWIRERNNRLGSKSTVHDRIGPAADIFRQIAAGLAHVHSKCIIHRDLKPSNVMASKGDDVQFLIGDFGLSKVTAAAGPTSEVVSPRRGARGLLLADDSSPPALPSPLESASGPSGDGSGVDRLACQDPHTAGIGTASYAAPEQVNSENYGAEADVYSLGLILLELLCSFSTEHERLQTFRDCRISRRVPIDIEDLYPKAAETILRCTEPAQELRPRAEDLAAISITLPLENRLTTTIVASDRLEVPILGDNADVKNDDSINEAWNDILSPTEMLVLLATQAVELRNAKKALEERDERIRQLTREIDEMKIKLDDRT